MAKAERRFLDILSYKAGIPSFARCTACGREFRLDNSLLSDPLTALLKFYADFDGHNCRREESEHRQLAVYVSGGLKVLAVAVVAVLAMEMINGWLRSDGHRNF